MVEVDNMIVAFVKGIVVEVVEGVVMAVVVSMIVAVVEGMVVEVTRRTGRDGDEPWTWTTTKGPSNMPAHFTFSGDLPGPKLEACDASTPNRLF